MNKKLGEDLRLSGSPCYKFVTPQTSSIQNLIEASKYYDRLITIAKELQTRSKDLDVENPLTDIHLEKLGRVKDLIDEALKLRKFMGSHEKINEKVKIFLDYKSDVEINDKIRDNSLKEIRSFFTQMNTELLIWFEELPHEKRNIFHLA